MMRAPFATAQRIALASASTGIDRCGPTTFATSSSAGGASPAIPMPSFVWAAIRPATNVPCPWVSTVAGPGTKLLEAAIRPCSSGWVPSTPGVDHGHPDRRERRRLGPEVERAVLGRVPLALQEGVIRDECLPAAPEHLDVPRPADAAQRRRARRRDGERRQRREVDDPASAPGAQTLGDRGAIRAGREPDREARGIGRRRRAPRQSRQGGNGACSAGSHLVAPGGDRDRQRRAGLSFRGEPIGRGRLRPDGDRERSVVSGDDLRRGKPGPVGAELLEQRRVDVTREAGHDDGGPGGCRGGRTGDAEDAEPEGGRPQAQPRPHIGGAEQDAGPGLLDERHRRRASGGRRHDLDVDDRGREPECLAERRRRERARRPAMERRERVPRIVPGLQVGRDQPEDILAGRRAAPGRRVVERRRDLPVVRQDLASRGLHRGGRRR